MDLKLNAKEEKKFEENLKLVHFIINKYFLKSNRGIINYDDLFQVGSIGLIKAIKRFNEDYGYKFSTYASSIIYGEIKKEISDKSYEFKIPREIRDKLYRIREYIHDNKNVSHEEISEVFGLSKQNSKIALKYIEMSFISKDSKIFNPKGLEKASFEEIIHDNNSFILELFNSIELEERLSILKQRDREIILLSLKGYTQSQIGKKYNISQVQVSRIVNGSIKKINRIFELEAV